MPEVANLAPADVSIDCFFWNIGNRDLTMLVSELAAARNAEVVLLAESPFEPNELAAALSEKCGRIYVHPETNTRSRCDSAGTQARRVRRDCSSSRSRE